MKPLILLLVVFVLGLVGIYVVTGVADYFFAGRLAMSVMLIFTTIGHFMFSQGMSLMVPVFIPFKKEVVYSTGILELAGAIGLLIPSLQEITAWLIILFFILILPANIFAAVQRLDYEKGTYDGPGLAYLWFRIPLQFLFIAWVWFFALHPFALER